MKLQDFSFIVICLFSLAGLIVITIAIHELSHWNDLKDLTTDNKICILMIGTTVENQLTGPDGVYRFTYSHNLTKYNQAKHVEESTENRAYTTSAVIIIIYFIMFYLTISNRKT